MELNPLQTSQLPLNIGLDGLVSTLYKQYP